MIQLQVEPVAFLPNVTMQKLNAMQFFGRNDKQSPYGERKISCEELKMCTSGLRKFSQVPSMSAANTI